MTKSRSIDDHVNSEVADFRPIGTVSQVKKFLQFKRQDRTIESNIVYIIFNMYVHKQQHKSIKKKKFKSTFLVYLLRSQLYSIELLIILLFFISIHYN